MKVDKKKCIWQVQLITVYMTVKLMSFGSCKQILCKLNISGENNSNWITEPFACVKSKQHIDLR